MKGDIERAKGEGMFIRDKKYSTRWIFVLRITSDEKLTKVHRILEFSPYKIGYEWHFAKHN
jgi:uncharacterized protein with NRDE domain